MYMAVWIEFFGNTSKKKNLIEVTRLRFKPNGLCQNDEYTLKLHVHILTVIGKMESCTDVYIFKHNKRDLLTSN